MKPDLALRYLAALQYRWHIAVMYASLTDWDQPTRHEFSGELVPRPMIEFYSAPRKAVHFIVPGLYLVQSLKRRTRQRFVLDRISELVKQLGLNDVHAATSVAEITLEQLGDSLRQADERLDKIRMQMVPAPSAKKSDEQLFSEAVKVVLTTKDEVALRDVSFALG